MTAQLSKPLSQYCHYHRCYTTVVAIATAVTLVWTVLSVTEVCSIAGGGGNATCNRDPILEFPAGLGWAEGFQEKPFSEGVWIFL